MKKRLSFRAPWLRRRVRGAEPASAVATPPAPPPSAPPPAWFDPEALPVTAFLNEEIAAGHIRGAIFEIHPAAQGPRAPFIVSDPIERAQAAAAPFAHYLVDPGYRTFRTAPIRCVAFTEGYVGGIDGIVFVDGRIVGETADGFQFWRPGCAVASFEPQRAVRFKPDIAFAPGIETGEFFVGFKPGWPNYAHWIKECLPRLLIFLLLRMRSPAMRIVLPDFAPDSFQQQTLDLLGIDEGMIFRIPAMRIVGFAHLTKAYGIDIWTVSPFMAQAAALLRSAHGARVPSGDGPPRQRVYIHRPAGVPRRVANFEECRPILEAAGFAIEVFDGKPLPEQIARMRAATCVVGEHGAGLANMVFCDPGTPVIEVFSPHCVQPAFWSLASRCGLPFGYLIGESAPPPGHPPDWGTDYTLSPDRLREALAVLP